MILASAGEQSGMLPFSKTDLEGKSAQIIDVISQTNYAFHD
jgi:hypothetical protein